MQYTDACFSHSRLREFQKWAPNLSVAVYKGPAAARAAIWDSQARAWSS